MDNLISREAGIFNRDYLDRLRDSDPETERHFTTYFGGLLTIKVRNRVRSPQLGEDIRQETLLRVLSIIRRNGVERPERLEALVHSVCNNVLLEAFRKEKYICRGSVIAEPVDQHPGPDMEYDARRQRSAVRSVIEQLPPKDRELLRQLFLEERDRDEVCDAFGVDRQYLRVLLHRAKTRFRAALRTQPDAPERSAAFSLPQLLQHSPAT